jgi:hypothetical protein
MRFTVVYVLDVREGVAGDMVLGALIDAGIVPLGEIANVLEASAKAMDPTAKVILKKETFGGEEGTTLNVIHWKFDEVSATSMKKHLNAAIRELQALKCRQTANVILDLILDAEAKVHTVSIRELHLHETGSPDTIVDILGTSFIYEAMGGADAGIKCTPIAAGSGKVKIAHGVFDVPPPATLTLLQGMKWFKGPYEGEMATPTGTAILRYIAKEQVGDVGSEMKKVGTGFGGRSFSGKRTAVRLYRA